MRTNCLPWFLLLLLIECIFIWHVHTNLPNDSDNYDETDRNKQLSMSMFAAQNNDQVTRNTLGSPCKNMHEEEDKIEFKKCGQFQFPVFGKNMSRSIDYSINFPSECWPRIAILPSYASSGNGLARRFFAASTGLAAGSQYNESANLVFDWGIYGQAHTQYWTNIKLACKNNLRLPYGGRVALVKTHKKISKQFQINIHPPEEEQIMNGRIIHDLATPPLQPLPSYIVRLVRNPGDNLLRNQARWNQPIINGTERTNDNFDAFKRRAKQICGYCLVRGSKVWMEFHEGWEMGSSHIPTVILRYEHMVDPNIAKEKMREVIEFVGEKQRFHVNYTEQLKPTKYVHGTLFRDICGIEMARKLNNVTASVSETFGYTFDHENGVWNIPE